VTAANLAAFLYQQKKYPFYYNGKNTWNPLPIRISADLLIGNKTFSLGAFRWNPYWTRLSAGSWPEYSREAGFRPPI